MDPVTALTVANGLVGLLETLAPQIATLVKKGEISPEDQKALDDRITALRPGGSAFAGPEWQVTKP